MSKNDKKQFFDEEIAGSRFAILDEDEYAQIQGRHNGYSSRWDKIHAAIQNYMGNSKVMLLSSLNHFRSPSTIIVLIILIAVYVLLTVGQVGVVGFSFRNSKVIQYITTNMDIVVNALLGFFYGPVISGIATTICAVCRMVIGGSTIYEVYIISAFFAGFLHGWILYRHKTLWFGTRFRGFHADLLARVFMTRLAITVFINILLMSLLYKIAYNISFYFNILHYSKSEVELQSLGEFFSIFIVSLAFETIVVFLALTVINFIVMKAFPSQMEQPSLLIDETGALINMEEEMMQNMHSNDMR